MTTGTIKIKGKQYKCSFMHRARRLFMEKHNIEYFDDYQNKLKSLQADPKKGMSLEGMGVFADLVITGIISEQPDFDDFDEDGLIDYFFEHPDEMVAIGELFSKAQERNVANRKSSGGSGGKSKGAG